MKARNEISLLFKMITLLENICITLAGLFLLFLLAIIVPGTISRYLFNYPFHFVEEYSGYLFVGMGFLAVSYALRKGVHVSVTAGVKHLSYRTRTVLEAVTTSAAICVAGLLFWHSFKFWYGNYQIHMVSSTIMQTPLWIPQLFIWLGWLTFVLSLVVHLTRKIREFRESEGEPAADIGVDR